jgi:hypothetical protein
LAFIPIIGDSLVAQPTLRSKGLKLGWVGLSLKDGFTLVSYGRGMGFSSGELFSKDYFDNMNDVG